MPALRHAAWTRLPRHAALSLPTSLPERLRTHLQRKDWNSVLAHAQAGEVVHLSASPGGWPSIPGRLAQARRRGSLPTDSLALAQCGERDSGLRGRSPKRDHVPVLTAIDRSGNRLKQVLGYRDDIREALQDRIEEGSVLCTDGLATYRGVARDAEAAVHVVVPSQRTKKFPPVLNQSLKGRLTLARVNAMHAHLKSFVNEQAQGVCPRGIYRDI